MFLISPIDAKRLGNFLLDNFADHRWTQFRAAVAYARNSGTRHILEALKQFAARSSVRITVGVDSRVTTAEALRGLLDAVSPTGSLWIFHNAGNSTFHPKVYLFRNDQSALVAVGSGNLTEGGLFTNYEIGALHQFDFRNAEQLATYSRLEKELNCWSSPTQGLCYQLDDAFLARLMESGLVLTEAAARATAEIARQTASGGQPADTVFTRMPVPRAPRVPTSSTDGRDEEGPADVELEPPELPIVAPRQGQNRIFLMTLQQTDVGHGQVTPGATRRSPEIFIPLAARDADATFWGWPNSFEADPAWSGPVDGQGLGKMDRRGVRILFGTNVVDTTIWYNPQKRDIRIRSEQLRSGGNVGDILYVERTDGTAGYTYIAQIVPQDSALHPLYLAKCVNNVRPPSVKLWGYI